MRYFFLLAVALTAHKVICQVLPDQVYVVGDNYLQDQCEVRHYCHHSSLIFFAKNRFFMDIDDCGIANNKAPSSEQMGTYEIKHNILYLHFKKAGCELLPDSVAKSRQSVLMKPLKFLITHCGEKTILKSDIKEFSYGSRDVIVEKGILNNIKQSKFWAKVQQELKRE